jgi:uncharacterized protein YkwD
MPDTLNRTLRSAARAAAAWFAGIALLAGTTLAVSAAGVPAPDPTARHVSGMTAMPLRFANPHSPVTLPHEATALLYYTNALRENVSLHALKEDPRLDQLAREAADKMARGGYFGHTDPNGVTLEHRVRASGHKLEYYGENISFDQDAIHAHNAFVNSHDHYKNIVDPKYNHLGTAAVKVGVKQVFFVQIFSS